MPGIILILCSRNRLCSLSAVKGIASLRSKLQASMVPCFPEAMEYARMGLVPAGTYKNREFREAFVDFAPSVDGFMQDILFDAQTSGGLLISAAREAANELLGELKRRGMTSATVIGEVVSEPKEKILVV